MERLTRPWTGLAAGIALLAAAAVPVFGGIAITDQSRFLHIDGNIRLQPLSPTDPPLDPVSFDQTVTADPDVPFNQTLQNQITLTDPNRPAPNTFGVNLAAAQNSTILSSGDTIALTASGTVGGSSGPAPAFGNGMSSYSVTFTVDAPATYHLDEAIDFAELSSFASVLLKEGSNVIAGAGKVSSSQSAPPPMSFDGTLMPGTYSLTAQGGGNGTQEVFSASYRASFTATTVPLPRAAGPATAMILVIGAGLLLPLRRSRGLHVTFSASNCEGVRDRLDRAKHQSLPSRVI